MHRNTVAQIDMAAIRHNYELANRLAPHSKNIAVVKADAYGHGCVPVARALERIAPALAVAILDEAVELRDAGVQCPLLILEGVDDAESMCYAAEHDCWVMLHDAGHLAIVESLTTVPSVWLKIDTGMHRLGFSTNCVEETMQRLHAAGVTSQQIVLCTHLATADDAHSDLVARQLSQLRVATQSLDCPLSIANSAGILAWPASHAEWNRPGYMLYGNSPMRDSLASAAELVPAMRLVSDIIGIRDIDAGASVGYGQRWTAAQRSRIGTVAIGYGDGYPGSAGDGTEMLVNGKPAPLVGEVSMDMTTVDLTDRPDARVGDLVILWGPELPVDRIAKTSGATGYELLTGVSRRVPRDYELVG